MSRGPTVSWCHRAQKSTSVACAVRSGLGGPRARGLGHGGAERFGAVRSGRGGPRARGLGNGGAELSPRHQTSSLAGLRAGPACHGVKQLAAAGVASDRHNWRCPDRV